MKMFELLNFIATFPLVLLGPPFNPLLPLLGMLVTGPWILIRKFIWEHYFLEIVPSLHNAWNSNLYEPLNANLSSGARPILLVRIPPDNFASSLKLGILPVNLDTATSWSLWSKIFSIRYSGVPFDPIR